MLNIHTIFSVFIEITTVIPQTLAMAFAIMFFATLLGLALASARIRKTPIISHAVVAFISFNRGTPLIVQLYITYYALPPLFATTAHWFGYQIDVNSISPLWAVIVTFSINFSARQAENIRAALLSIDQGQIEAAQSIGLTPLQALLRIVLPQSLRMIIPSTCNTFLISIKALSLAFTVSVIDILAKAKLCSVLNYSYIESYIAAALMYWVLCTTLTFLFYRLGAIHASHDTIQTV